MRMSRASASAASTCATARSMSRSPKGSRRPAKSWSRKRRASSGAATPRQSSARAEVLLSPSSRERSAAAASSAGLSSQRQPVRLSRGSAIAALRLHMDQHLGPWEQQLEVVLEVVAEEMRTRHRLLSGDDEVEVDVPLRTGLAGAQLVIAGQLRIVLPQQLLDLRHLVGRERAVNQMAPGLGH